MDFSLVEFSDHETSGFKKFRRSNTATLSYDEYAPLCERHFVKKLDPFPYNQNVKLASVELSEDGERLRNYRAARRREAVAEWIKFFIPVTLSIVSLMITIISTLWK